MSVIAICGTCGEVDFDDLKRDLKTAIENDEVIETITVSCSRCGGSSFKEYRTPKDKWMLLNGYSGHQKRGQNG